MELDSLRNKLAAYESEEGTVGNLRGREEVAGERKLLNSVMNTYAQQENDTLLNIQASSLEKQIELKQQSEETMVRVLTRQI